MLPNNSVGSPLAKVLQAEISHQALNSISRIKLRPQSTTTNPNNVLLDKASYNKKMECRLRELPMHEFSMHRNPSPFPQEGYQPDETRVLARVIYER